MKKLLSLFSVSLLFLTGSAPAAEFKDAASVLAVDFPAGWQSAKSDDPAVVIRLERGKASFEFSKLDSELSDYYLKARVKEQVDSLRGKGNTLAGEIHQAGIRGAAVAYYTSYESMGATLYIAFFTYDGVSYAVSASGLGDGEFRGVISTVRKPGEKIAQPKPRTAKARRPARKEPEEITTQIFNEVEPEAATVTPVATSTAAAAEPAVQAATAATISAGEEALRRTQDLISAMELNKGAAGPYLPRRPLDFRIWLALAALWAIGAFRARAVAARFQNPKMVPQPKEVPPDFFFPFLVTRESASGGCSYSVLTRQKQLLFASFNSGNALCTAGAVYGCLFFHALWSLLDFAGRGGLVPGALLALPGGRLWASTPELVFAALLAYGLYRSFGVKRTLRVYDSKSNLLLESGEEGKHCILRDEKGKEIARIARKAAPGPRAWDFIDTDNQVVFTVRDDNPAALRLRKLFGRQGGLLRSRYGIFADERRAGFVYLDPTSDDRFQIMLDFDFARLAHPAHILNCVLYIVSSEKDPAYPWPF